MNTSRQNIQLLSPSEAQLRIKHLLAIMQQCGIQTLVLNTPTSTFYVTGRVFRGFIVLNNVLGHPIYFPHRPVNLEGPDIYPIHKPEQILETMPGDLRNNLGVVALQLDTLPYNLVQRLCKAFNITTPANADAVMSLAMAVKTPEQQELIRLSGSKHEHVYRQIPALFNEGMTDIELQIEIERTSRLEGCLGLFRVNGFDMELYMGSTIAGPNADAPSPYDFAMGGAGQNSSIPVGGNGTIIRPGMAVMVDVNGNYTGYMTDMTRTFSLGTLPAHVTAAHELSRRICRELQGMARPGVSAAALYERAVEIVKENGLENHFMGHNQKAPFVGHGVGICVNELPVLAPRSKQVLQAGNVIAVEPKFVFPEQGAVGIENTYIVRPQGPAECVTNAPEEILPLDA